MISETPSNSPVRFRSEYGLFKVSTPRSNCALSPVIDPPLPSQRCDSSSWTGTSTTCREFPSRRKDCSTPYQLFTLEALELSKSASNTPADLTSTFATAPSSLKAKPGPGEGRHDHGKDDDEEMWTFCDSWISAG